MNYRAEIVSRRGKYCVELYDVASGLRVLTGPLRRTAEAAVNAAYEALGKLRECVMSLMEGQ
jgi:hypothetical protein